MTQFYIFRITNTNSFTRHILSPFLTCYPIRFHPNLYYTTPYYFPPLKSSSNTPGIYPNYTASKEFITQSIRPKLATRCPEGRTTIEGSISNYEASLERRNITDAIGLTGRLISRGEFFSSIYFKAQMKC